MPHVRCDQGSRQVREGAAPKARRGDLLVMRARYAAMKWRTPDSGAHVSNPLTERDNIEPGGRDSDESDSRDSSDSDGDDGYGGSASTIAGTFSGVRINTSIASNGTADLSSGRVTPPHLREKIGNNVSVASSRAASTSIASSVATNTTNKYSVAAPHHGCAPSVVSYDSDKTSGGGTFAKVHAMPRKVVYYVAQREKAALVQHDQVSDDSIGVADSDDD